MPMVGLILRRIRNHHLGRQQQPEIFFSVRKISHAQVTRHTPPSALNRDSFLLAKQEPFSVSACGQPFLPGQSDRTDIAADSN